MTDSQQLAHRFREVTLDGKPDAIMAISTISRKGQLLDDGSELGDRKTTHHRLFTKTNDEWQIVAHLISDARSIKSNKH